MPSQGKRPFNVLGISQYFLPLGISQYFLPLNTPRAVRLGVLARYTQTSGLVNWTILCASPRTLPHATDPEMQAIVSPKTRVLRIPSLGGRFSRHLRLLRGQPKSLLMLSLPDARIGWFPLAVRFAQNEIERGRYDIIQSFSTPTTSHLVGGFARLKYRLPWVAFFSDPWNGMYEVEKGSKGILNRFLERWVFETADVLAFPWKDGANWALTNFPERIRRKAVILSHCFDPDLYNWCNSPEILLKRKDKMRVLHAGSFYGPRTPSPLLSGIDLLRQQEPAAVADLDVVLLGAQSENVEREIRKYNLEGTVRRLPAIPYLKCLAVLQDADVLLVIDPPFDTNPFFPSKLVDYLGARRPILGLTPPKGPTAQILRSVDQPIVSPWEHNLIARQLSRLRHAWREGALVKHRPRPEAITSFSVESVSEKLIDLYKTISIFD
ncbi:MAG: hypothetical protein HY788_04710 [Deltaproteobacteria bacterium]|nr:hypothetical protein [Deltaproteobacteria bacterium]